MRQRGTDDAGMRGQHDRQRLGPGFVIAVGIDGGAQREAGIVDDDIEAAEMRSDRADDLGDVVGLGDVERPGFRGAASGRDFIRDGLRGLGGEIGDGNVGALGGEHQRGGAAHAAGGAGDENGQALDRTAELSEI